MEKIEIVVRFTKDNGKSHEQTIFEWSEKSYVDQKILYFPGLEIHLASHLVFKNGSEIYMSRYEYGVLEHLTKPKSDQSGSKGEKSQMDISPAFISDEQAPVSMEPGKGSLNNPAVLSKMRGTVHPTSGNAVLYMSHCARLSAKRKIVPFISVKFLRTTSGSPVQISQGRQMIQHIFQHFAIIHIGGSEADNKRNAIAIRYEMMFASRTTSIYGVGSCVFAPLFAWMTEPSIQALLQSIFFVSCKFCRMTW